MKTLTILFVFIFFFSLTLFSQDWLKNLPKKNPGDKPLTLPTIQKAFNDYWDPYNVKGGYYFENGEKKKAPGWKLFKRWEWYWEQRVNIETGEFPNTNSVIEYEKSKDKLNKVTSLNENWVNLGPNSSTGGYAGIGRINCVAFHPTDANTFWIGSPSGGIWKTTDGGSSWSILNNNETVLGVSDVAITSDYVTSQTLYIATGDRDGNLGLIGQQQASNVSVGVYKSTDSGTNWNATGLTFAKTMGKRIFRLLIDPTDNSILLASANNGIYKTTDSGTSWTLKDVKLTYDMEFKPGDHNTIYGSFRESGSSYITKSTDNGENWSYLSIASGGYRSELAVTANDPSVVYMLTTNSSEGLLGVYKSTDSGINFFQVNTNTSQNMLGYFSDGSGATSGQGGYDLSIAASPSDANTVFIGGINTWKSTDGGVTWIISNMWTSSSYYNKSGAPVAHADKHALAFQNGTILFEGNDGGIYKTNNGGTNWTDLTNGMVISQIYRIGISQTEANTILTGLQDNGTKKYFGSSWSDVLSGDGMECIIDHSNINYMYASMQRGYIYRSSNGFTTFGARYISGNIPGGTPAGAWVTPYIMDPSNSAIIYAGYDKVWKTTDRGNSWTSASQQFSASNKLWSLVIAPSNTSVLYTSESRNMWKTTDGGATNWTTVTLPASRFLTDIAVHNTDPNTIWITYGGYNGAKVYESTNGGSSWTNISTGLPNLPVMSVVYYKSATDRNVLFVGTDLGVYVKDGTANWASYNTGLPNVLVTELEIYYNTGGGADKLRAGTYGRGLWETEILAPLPVELTSFTGIAIDSKIELKWVTETEVNNFGFEIERASPESFRDTPGQDEWEKIGFVDGNGNSNSPKQYSFTDKNPIGESKFRYRLKQIDTDGKFEYSDVVEVELIPNEFVLYQNYPNPFNPSTNIKFSLPEDANVSIKIYNSIGELVTELTNKEYVAGYHKIVFNASGYGSGVYFYRIETNKFTDIKKLILLK